MKFTITLNKEDFCRFQKYATARINQSPGMRWKVTLFGIGYWCFLSVFLLEMYSVYDKDCCYDYKHLNIAMTALGIWFLLTNLWQQLYIRLYVSHAADERGSVLGEWLFELTESGIKESNEMCSSSFSWQSIQSVETDKFNMYLFTDKLKALILPRAQITEEIKSVIEKSVINQSSESP